MPIRIEDVVPLDRLRRELDAGLKGVLEAFDECAYAFQVVIEAHNALEAKLDALKERIDGLALKMGPDS